MTTGVRRIASLGIFVLFAVVLIGAAGQDPNYLKHNSGQSIQPIFEGWFKNPDGSLGMRFGYLNRNYVEALSVPIGPDNNMEPGGPDRDQPSYFYTRVNRNLFNVTVPKDWGKKELVWTLTVHGKTEKAIGWLEPEWEIDPIIDSVSGSRPTNDTGPKNQPPTLVLDPVPPVTLPNSATLTAAVTDDGLPKPPARGRGRGGDSTPSINRGSLDAPVNVPAVENGDARPPIARGGGAGGRRMPPGLSLEWIVWRGPAGATFDPALTSVKDGKAAVRVTFVKPGAYVLRARAMDGALKTEKDVSVTVTEPKASK